MTDEIRQDGHRDDRARRLGRDGSERGRLSRWERFRLNRQLDRQSIVIHRLRHNGRTAEDTNY